MRTAIVFEPRAAGAELPVPEGLEAPVCRAASFRTSLKAAAHSHERVLIIPADAHEIPPDLVHEMHRELDADPMAGCCSLVFSEAATETRFSPVPRSLFVLFRGDVVDEMLSAAPGTDERPGAIIARLALEANRVGYGTLALSCDRKDTGFDALGDDVLCAALSEEFPGFAEGLLAYRRRSGLSATAAGRPHVILDFSQLPALFNGTAEVGFHILFALLEVGECELSVIAQEAAITLFRLSEVEPRLRVLTSSEHGVKGDVVFRLSQPFSNFELSNLACQAPRTIFLIHDSISFDCLQLRRSQPDLGAIWNLMAEHADMLIFGSEFSRNIFAKRFIVPPSTSTAVCHWSFTPADYLAPPPYGAETEGPEATDSIPPYCAVLGNQYYAHKGIEHVVPMFQHRFSGTTFRCLGLPESPAENIIGLPSGHLSWNQISGLMSGAECVIIPTFYEGFGLPLFHSLSRGKTVFARHSALLDELMPNWAGPGKLVRYRTTADLGDKLEGFLGGNGPGEDILGPGSVEERSSSSRSRNWRTIGRELSDLLISVARRPPEKYRRRIAQQLFSSSFDELVLFDENLRMCIAQRDSLQTEVRRCSESLRVAFKQRDALQAEVSEYDECLRTAIKQRDGLQEELNRYDENLRVAISQREELRERLENQSPSAARK